MTWGSDLQGGIVQEFVDAAVWSANDAFKAMSMHVQWHTDRMTKGTDKARRYLASLLVDDTKRDKRLAAKRACAKAAYERSTR